MSDPKSKSLVDEIIANARSDRKRLEAVANGLTHGFGEFTDNANEEGGMDPEVSAAFAEEISKVSDSLSKINSQLIELVKLEFKGAATDPKTGEPPKMTKAEKEELYEELAGEELN